MEKLTVRDGEHILMTDTDLSKHRGDACTALLAKLAAYEDTGLTPEEITALQAEVERLNNVLKYVIDGLCFLPLADNVVENIQKDIFIRLEPNYGQEND